MKILNPIPKERVLPAALYGELDAYIDTLDITEDEPRKKEALIKVLHKAQNLFGFLSEELQIHVAN